MSRVDVSIKRLDPAVSLPEYAYSGDAGLDLRCNESVDLAPFERRLVYRFARWVCGFCSTSKRPCS